jgi:hypothetical protein
LQAEGSLPVPSAPEYTEMMPTGNSLLSSEYGGDDPLVQYALWAGGNAAALLAMDFLGEAVPSWLSRVFKAKCPAAGNVLKPGSFSVIDWGTLPEHLRPTGPLNLLQTGSDELVAAQRAKALANDALRSSLDLRGVPMDIHEIQPVKFGGSPTDLGNKTLVPRDFHQQVVTPFWNQLQRDIGP